MNGKYSVYSATHSVSSRLIKAFACNYYKNVNTIKSLRQLGQSEIWDIEDLKKIGNERTACPYFAARNIAEDAEIVFCPYSYLIGTINSTYSLLMS